MESPWRPLTIASGYADAYAANPSSARLREDGIVELAGSIRPLTSTPNAIFTTVATLPSGIRPIANLYFALSGNTTASLAGYVLTGGQIQLWNSPLSSAYVHMNGVSFRAS